MITENIQTVQDLKNIHFTTLEWKSSLEFISDEAQFINQLLNSYVFEPNTPNLFERLQEFKEELSVLENDLKILHEHIRNQENKLGGMLECDTISCDEVYLKGIQLLEDEIITFDKKFKSLKSRVFRYAGSILKNKKK